MVGSRAYTSLPGVKILWINPLGTSAYDSPMADLIRQIKEPRTTVELVSLKMNATLDNLEYRTLEALVVRETIELSRHAAANGFDGVVIGCFSDPALLEAREISGDVVVVAPCEASLQVVTRLCNRFSVIVGQEFWIYRITQRVREYGLQHKLASMRSIDCPVPQMQSDPAITKGRIAVAARKAIEEDGAEAIVLGCTIEFGLFQELQASLDVPVIDPLFASLKACEFAAGLKKAYGWKPSRIGSCQAPSESDLSRFGLFTGAPPIGNTIVLSASR